MKTNAKPATIVKAVEKVSNEKYKGNIIFRRKPQSLTKNVIRFTLRVKDKNLPGAMIGTGGLKQPKADQQVYLDVMEEIFRMERKREIYGDHDVLGRVWADSVITDKTVFEDDSNDHTDAKQENLAIDTLKKENPVIEAKRGPGRPRKTPQSEPAAEQQTTMFEPTRIIDAIKFLLDHPQILKKIEREQKKLLETV